MNDNMLPSDIRDVFQLINNRLSLLEMGSIGTVALAGTITAYDPESGVKTVVGDLSQVGEERVGIAQFVGDTTPPPVPTTPIVSASPGIIAITWDGTNVDAEKMAPDFDHFNVYGTSSGSTYLVGSIKNESEVAVYAGADGGTVWKFYLTSVDTNRNESGPSELSAEIVAINAGADPLVYDAIEDLRRELAEAELLANAANQLAQSAQNKADEALKAAHEGGISKIVIDEVEPSVKEDKMIWVNTSVDPFVASRWDSITSSWKPVEDSSLADLAMTAAYALRAAEQASAAAETAMIVAGQAQSSANGKNNVYYVPSLPGGSNFVVGDTAFIRSAVGEPVTGQSQWDGSSWKSVTLNHQVISSVDLGKATIGELDGAYIKAQTITAKNLVLQNTDNMLNDPRFQYGTSTWNGLNSWDSHANGVLKKESTSAYIVNTPTPVSKLVVTPGEWYSLGFGAKTSALTYLKYSSSISWYDNENVLIYEDVVHSERLYDLGTTTSILAKSSPRRAPMNAWYAVPKVSFNYMNSNNSTDTHTLSVNSLTFTHAMDANLIVDGSIVASKIEANSISADQIVVGGLKNIFKDPTLALEFDILWDDATSAYDYRTSTRSDMVNSFFSTGNLSHQIYSRNIVLPSSIFDDGLALSVDVKSWQTFVPDVSNYSSAVPVGASLTFYNVNGDMIGEAYVEASSQKKSSVSSSSITILPLNDWANFTFKVSQSSIPLATTQVEVKFSQIADEITNIRLVQTGAGVSISDGAISADHIQSNSISTDKLVAGSVTSDIVSADVINGMAFNGVSFDGGSFTIYKDPSNLLTRFTEWIPAPVWPGATWKHGAGYSSTPPPGVGSSIKLLELISPTAPFFGVIIPVNLDYVPGMQIIASMTPWLRGLSAPPDNNVGNTRPTVTKPFEAQMIVNTDKGSLTATINKPLTVFDWRAGYYVLSPMDFKISAPPGRKIISVHLILNPGDIGIYAKPYVGEVSFKIVKANGSLSLTSDSTGTPGLYGTDSTGVPTVSLTSSGLTLPNDFTARTVSTAYPTNFGLYSAGTPIEVSRFGRMVQLTGAWKYTGTSASSDAITSTNEVVVMNKSLQADSTPLRNMTFINQGTGSKSWALTVKSDGTLCCSRYSGTLSASSNLIWLNFNVTYMI